MNKLRNKKTQKIGELAETGNGICVVLDDSGEQIYYETLAEIVELWEDVPKTTKGKNESVYRK